MFYKHHQGKEKSVTNNILLLMTSTMDIDVSLDNNLQEERRAFMQLWIEHKDFFAESVVFDGYLIAIAFILFKRANIKASEMCSETLFASLHLACGT